MNNEALQEKALQYALGTLPEEEVENIEARLKTDRELQTAVHEWQRVNEADALDCDQLAPSFQVYSRIMSSLETGSAEQADGKAVAKQSPISFLTWGGWAAAACLTLFLVLPGLREGGDGAGQLDRLADRAKGDIVLSDLGNPDLEKTFVTDQHQDEFQDRLLELTGLAEAYWFSREGLPPESDDSSDFQAFSGGFSIYDRKIKIGVIGIENIPENRLGTFYNVWAKASPDSEPVWAGTLKPDEAGSRLAFFDLSSNDAIKDMDDEISFFVTEEREQRPAQPEGRIVLSGI